MFDIITDSACDLTPETAATLNIEIIPFYVSLDGEHYRKEGKEIPRPACLRWRILKPPSGPMPRRAARCSASALPAR